MQTTMLTGRPFFRRVPLEIDSYVSGRTRLTVTLPDWSQEAAIGLSIYPYAALTDHQAEQINHNEYDAITQSEVGGESFGAPLGHVASFIGRANLTASQPLVPGKGMQFWPGLDSNPGMPCARNVAMIPIKGTREFRINLRRLFGATSVTAAYLWLAPIEDRATHSRLCDGRKNMVGRPHWLSQRVQLAAAAGLNSSPVQTRWNAYDDFALRIFQQFASVYVNTAGTLSYDPAYSDAVAMQLRGWNGERLFPDYAEDPQRIAEMTREFIQEYDCTRDWQIQVPAKTGLRMLFERATTAQIKDLFTSFYGVLAQ